MRRVLLIFAIFSLVSSNCVLRHNFAAKCIYYKYSEPNCRPGAEETTCNILFVRYNDFVCPKYFCVSLTFSMCYSRDLFCNCCFHFVKLLTVNVCSVVKVNENCPKKWVFPKATAKCESCEKCTKQCTPLKKIPRKWKQPSQVYIDRFKYTQNGRQFLIDLKTESKNYIILLNLAF